MAEATWWLSVAGVAGVVVTTLGFKFGGSWVFLYPMPFYGAGEWGKWTAFFFSGSVLLVGLSIVTWCLSILHTVLGPGAACGEDEHPEPARRCDRLRLRRAVALRRPIRGRCPTP